MSDRRHLLARLTAAVVQGSKREQLADRLCAAYRDVASTTGAAVTMWYGEPHRITLAATDSTAARLEDLQEVIGEGPGHSAWQSGRIESVVVPDRRAATRWPAFTDAAAAQVEFAVLHAVPIRPWDETLGVVTTYQLPHPPPDLLIGDDERQFLANAVGAALIRDTRAVEDQQVGAWSSPARIHQAAGMVVARLHVSPEDALALLRAHAYADDVTLSHIADSVLARRLDFPVA